MAITHDTAGRDRHADCPERVAAIIVVSGSVGIDRLEADYVEVCGFEGSRQQVRLLQGDGGPDQYPGPTYSDAAIIGTALKSEVLEKRKRWCTLRGHWCAVRTGNMEGYADKSFMEKIARDF